MESISCTTPEQIVAPMRSWKGKLPVVQVVGWEPRGDHVVAHLRQPAFGDDADRYQVLSVRAGRIASLEDHPTRDSALAAGGR